MKLESTLQEIVQLLGLQSDSKLRCLLESLLEDVKEGNLLENDLIETDQLLPQLPDVDLRKILRQLEERIEDLLEEIVCLLKKLRKKGKGKLDGLEKKRLLNLVLQLINLMNLKSLIEKLLPIGDKGK